MDAYLIDAVRTPFGRFRGGLSGVRTDDLAAAPIVELLARHPDIDPATSESIILERESQPRGFTSIMYLLTVPSLNRARLARLYPLLTVRSNVYVVTCRGRDLRTGLEVEMIATLDRSALPVVIKDLRVR